MYSQPSGLSIQEGKVYVADSEISAVREVELDPAGKVRTLVGTGLFDFGDKDGVGNDALLQHCIGLGWHQGTRASSTSPTATTTRSRPSTPRRAR
jgi:hypothetical protein